MDPFTHALSGAVLVCSIPSRYRAGWMPLWGALVAACPDLDVLVVHSPLEYILWHRGPTHSLLGIALIAVLAAAALLACLALDHRRRPPGDRPELVGWTPAAAWKLSFALLLLHVWLDCVTSYGTQVFWPFSNCRVRFSGLFIVDALLLLPLAAGVLFWRSRPRRMVCLLIWCVVYPAGACLARPALEWNLASALPPAVEGGRPVQAVNLTPDLGAPFFWRAVIDTPEDRLTATYLPCGAAPSRFAVWSKPPEPLWTRLAETDRTFAAYKVFAQFPVLEETLPEPGGVHVDVFTDLRFGSSFAFVRRIQQTHEDVDKIFRIMARLSPGGVLTGVRFRVAVGGGGDSGWQAPRPPVAPEEAWPWSEASGLQYLWQFLRPWAES